MRPQVNVVAQQQWTSSLAQPVHVHFRWPGTALPGPERRCACVCAIRAWQRLQRRGGGRPAEAQSVRTLPVNAATHTTACCEQQSSLPLLDRFLHVEMFMSHCDPNYNRQDMNQGHAWVREADAHNVQSCAPCWQRVHGEEQQRTSQLSGSSVISLAAMQWTVCFWGTRTGYVFVVQHHTKQHNHASAWSWHRFVALEGLVCLLLSLAYHWGSCGYNTCFRTSQKAMTARRPTTRSSNEYYWAASERRSVCDLLYVSV
jgi:hypothetical protein